MSAADIHQRSCTSSGDPDKGKFPLIYGFISLAYTRSRTNVEQARHLNHRSCLVLDPSRRKFDTRHFCVGESRIVRQVSLT